MNFASVFNLKIIFQSWVDSLKIFLPANLIRFLAGALKSFVEGVKAVATQVLWRFVIIGLVIVGILLLYQTWCPSCLFAERRSSQAVLIFLLMAIMLFLDFIVAIRSTTEIKNYAYFKRYISAFPGVLLIGFIFFGIQWGLSRVYASNLFFMTLPYVEDTIQSKLISIAFFLILFFFLESNRTIIQVFKSFWRTIMFVIFNLPGLIVLGYLSVLVTKLLFYLNVWFSLGAWLSILIVLDLMIFICILYTYFMQRVNANKKLYS